MNLKSIQKILPYIPIASTGWGIYVLSDLDKNTSCKINKIAGSVFSTSSWMPKNEKKAHRRVNQIRGSFALFPIVGNIIVAVFDLVCHLKNKSSFPGSVSVTKSYHSERSESSQEKQKVKTFKNKKLQGKQKEKPLRKKKANELYQQAIQAKGEEKIVLLKEAINAGNVSAMTDLAWINLFDRSVKKSDERDREAAKLLEKAFEQGDMRAAAYLAIMYREGIGGVKKDRKKAKEILEVAAKKGNAEAIYRLGLIYEREALDLKLSLKINEWDKTPLVTLEDFDLLLEGEEFEDQERKFFEDQRKRLEEEIKNPPLRPTEKELETLRHDFENQCLQAKDFYEKAAEKGEIGAMFRFSALFIGEGRLIKPTLDDEKKVLYWLNKAIEMKSTDAAVCFYSAQAKFNLGLIYQEGWESIGGNTKQNKSQGSKLLKEAAASGLIKDDQLEEKGLMGTPISEDLLDQKFILKRRCREKL